MSDRNDDVQRIVTRGQARGLTDDQIRAFVKLYDERRHSAPMPGPSETSPSVREPAFGLEKATGIEAGSRVEDFQRQVEQAIQKAVDFGGAETAGGLAGGAVGTYFGMPTVGATSGAALTRWLRGELEGTPATAGEIAFEGGMEAVPLLGKGLKSVGRFLGNAALKPGFRLAVPATEEVLTSGSRDIAARFPNVDVVEEVLQRGRPIRNAGLVQSQEALGEARRRALEAVDEFAASRPKVAGLLPEGRRAIPLGNTPTPSGGQLATPLADVTQFRRQSESRALQGMDPDDPLDPIFGGGPRAEPPIPTADIVSGPGTISRTLSEAGISPRSAPLQTGASQMVGVEEALGPAREKLAGMANVGLPARKRALEGQIAEYAAEYPDPVDVTLAQLRKDVSADEAANIYRQAKGMADDEGSAVAQFHEMLAQGNREAVERRVPNIGPLNVATQQELAIRDALLEAFAREARSGRFTLSGLLDNPRLLGVPAHAAYRTGMAIASKFSPGVLRALQEFIVPTPSHETTQRRQIGSK